MQLASIPYRNLCTQYYELDKPIVSSDALAHYLEYAKEAQGPILEPMCGTGRFLLPMLEKGYRVTGFDYSPHMLDVCRKKSKELGLNAELVEATFETFIPRCKYNLIFIPSGSFCLLTDQKQISQALKFISSWLAPNGKFIFEIETLKSIVSFIKRSCSQEMRIAKFRSSSTAYMFNINVLCINVKEPCISIFGLL